MSDKDELRDLWASPPGNNVTGDEMFASVQKDLISLDRRVLAMKVIVCLGVLFIMPVFVLLAFTAHDLLRRTGSLVQAASCIWIAFHILRYDRAVPRVDPAHNLAAYTHALVERYDSRIRFHKSFGYWYILPSFIGFMIWTAGSLMDRAKSGQLRWIDLADLAYQTLLWAFVWWMHESFVVGRLRKERAKLISMTAEAVPEEEKPE